MDHIVFQRRCINFVRLSNELNESALNLEKIGGVKRHAGSVGLQRRVGLAVLVLSQVQAADDELKSRN